ncbi:MAG TPA: trypsin-like peptidase domain-containing protein [Methylophilus sp.]|nr:trypsin-like peptidase domain-containing protein [Methylophilus sp.]HQQ33769.1 trypsin-like peptidase domain-containing protein [Methylophilus sp.]
MMNKCYSVFLLLFTLSMATSAEPNHELTYQLKASVVKVHVTTKTGGHGVGSGVVVDKDLVATNCHVLANATGVNITKYGDSFAPVGLRADWKHDVCLLRFQYLDIKPVELGDSKHLQYEQEIFSIGFPGGPPKPQVIYGNVKAVYPYEDSMIVRTDAAFVMGASGSPVFDTQGRLIALNTFKSPGRSAYFYNVPVEWVKALMDKPETTSLQTEVSPFWDAPENARPYFMQVVGPYQNQDWQALEKISEAWVNSEPSNAEAHYYLAYAQYNLDKKSTAMMHFEAALKLQPNHVATRMAQTLIKQGDGLSLAAKDAHGCTADHNTQGC